MYLNINRAFVLSSLLFLVSSCEKEVDVSELDESDFHGKWEHRIVRFYEGVDSAHVSIDSAMSLIDDGYELYMDNSYMTFFNANPTRTNLENFIEQFFPVYSYSYSGDTAIDLISFELNDGEHIVRSQGLNYFNDKFYRTYRYPNDDLELQWFDEDVASWFGLFQGCCITTFEKNKSFRYPVQDTSKNLVRADLRRYNPTSGVEDVILIRSLNYQDFDDEYYKFVR